MRDGESAENADPSGPSAVMSIVASGPKTLSWKANVLWQRLQT